MTSAGLFDLLLFLHILGAIVAFGPSLSFALIARFGAREPQHANFATRLQEMLSRRVVIPVAITLAITGVGMIWVRQIELAARPNWWLGLSIVLYALLLAYAILVQVPAVSRVVALTSGGPTAGSGGAGAPGGGSPGAGGPPPQLQAAIGRVKRGGMLLSAGVVVIVLLMVLQPVF